MLEQVRYVDSSGSWQDRKTADALELVKFLRTSPTDLKNVPYGPYKDKRQGQLNKVSTEFTPNSRRNGVRYHAGMADGLGRNTQQGQNLSIIGIMSPEYIQK